MKHDIDPRLLAILNENYTVWKRFPSGEIAAVMRLTFGRGRICTGLDLYGNRDSW